MGHGARAQRSRHARDRPLPLLHAPDGNAIAATHGRRRGVLDVLGLRESVLQEEVDLGNAHFRTSLPNRRGLSSPGRTSLHAGSPKRGRIGFVSGSEGLRRWNGQHGSGHRWRAARGRVRIEIRAQSNPLADRLGYRHFFLFVVVVSIPSIIAAWLAPFPNTPDTDSGAGDDGAQA